MPTNKPTAPKDQLIDWANPRCKITDHFTVGDALMLREWGRLATKADGLTDEIKTNIVTAAQWMEKARAILGKPVFVKSWYRPKVYNSVIGGAKFSQHMLGNAVDFWADQDSDGDKDGKDCDDIKALLMPKLAELGLRLEDNGKAARWCHLDSKPVPAGGNRFFKR